LLVAVLATDGVEQVELFKPVNALRRNNAEFAVAFVRHFVEAGKPIAAICHAPWDTDRGQRRQWALHDILGIVGNRPAQCRCALGGPRWLWEDRAVVVDGNLVTSR
jgi:protease I